MPSQKATALANANIAFIKWTISKHPAHYIDCTTGDWDRKPRLQCECSSRDAGLIDDVKTWQMMPPLTPNRSGDLIGMWLSAWLGVAKKSTSPMDPIHWFLDGE